jgi:hypothetical protein
MTVNFHWGEPKHPSMFRFYSTTISGKHPETQREWSSDIFGDRAIQRWYGISFTSRLGSHFVGVTVYGPELDARETTERRPDVFRAALSLPKEPGR